MPRGARHLRTYVEYESYLADFVSGLYPFLWVVGRPGIGKTESMRTGVRRHKVYYRKGGQLTPARFYIECYQNRGTPIILDDAEHLLDHKIGAKLILALADTSPTKQLCYGTTSRVLGDIPPNFVTTSPLLILSNQATELEAIQNRGPTLYFDPTNIEVHRAVARWFWDQEVHDWFGQHLYRLPALDTRMYILADQDKRARRNWQQTNNGNSRQNIILTTLPVDRAACVVQDLEGDRACPARDDKARRFEELMGHAKGASRASYYRLRRRLEEEQRLIPTTIPSIPLRRTKPPGIPSLVELESIETPPPTQPEEEPSPLDVPAREQFAEPVRGSVAPPASSGPKPFADDADKLAWEKPSQVDDGDEE